MNYCPIYIFIILFAIGCSGVSSQNKFFSKRVAQVDYTVVEVVEGDLEDHFQKHFFLALKDRFGVHGFNLKGKYVLVVDSGESASKDVACTLVKAEGRSKILNWVSNAIYLQNQGKPWDLLFKGRGKEIIKSTLKASLKREEATDFYWEKRLQDKKTSFVCSAAIELEQSSWEKLQKALTEKVMSEYLHLDPQELDLSFPASP